MSILINKNSKIIVQGITGNVGSKAANAMAAYGANIVAGIKPNAAGTFINLNNKDVPIYSTIADAKKQLKQIDCSLIIVPAAFVYNAVLEAINNKIKLIVIITENMLLHEEIKCLNLAKKNKCQIIGPNCAGIICPSEKTACGIIPTYFANKKGPISIISKSGSLIYLTLKELQDVGFNTCISIGGDRLIGTNIIDLIKMFEKDPNAKTILIYGEAGGNMETLAAEYIKKNKCKKEYIFYIAGVNIPVGGTAFGHAGAISNENNCTALAKYNTIKKCGCKIYYDLFELFNDLT